jgi:hypothetical protein
MSNSTRHCRYSSKLFTVLVQEHERCKRPELFPKESEWNNRYLITSSFVLIQSTCVDDRTVDALLIIRQSNFFLQKEMLYTTQKSNTILFSEHGRFLLVLHKGQSHEWTRLSWKYCVLLPMVLRMDQEWTRVLSLLGNRAVVRFFQLFALEIMWPWFIQCMPHALHNRV